jgi:integrase
MRTILRRALGQAEREGIIARNVAALSAPPRVRAKEGRTLTVDQARHLLDAVAGHRFEVIIILALAYGMRRGEVLGLRWSALDWDAGILQVTHSVQRIKSREEQTGRRTQLVVGELKTPRSRRSLALTPEIAAKLRQHHTRQAERKMVAGLIWRDHGLIFASEVGTPIDPENFSRTFSKLCKRAGLGHWHPHELRHSGASLMLAQGTPLHVVSEILGHASITITKDVNGHLVEGDRRAVAASMSLALFGPGSAAVAPNMAPSGTKKAPPRSG